MSFSQEVKQEIEKSTNAARHCQLAEMASFIINAAQVDTSRGIIRFISDNEAIILRINNLLKKLYGSDTEIISNSQRSNIIEYSIEIYNAEDILKSVKYTSENTISELLIKNTCCKRAVLQTAFLCIGSVTDPEKGYHLEFVSADRERLLQLKEILHGFELSCGITARKNQYVLYIKEGQAIVDLLNIMGAHVSLMNMENAIIMKDFRNGLNRKVNCETANLIKTVNAGSRQIADIEYLQAHYGLDKLPEPLREIAYLRLDNPDISLKDLGEMLNPPVGKSGVNHRFRKISEMVDKMQGK